ncbi:hypothetical protein DH2020_028251 [Rehmannia glutinosa]|uniref:ENTH domain-containing protein n=1 Tax=Rehmannia glutinosa TaxID=99300 RepID=A0ABR0VVJ3_REHGL
MSMLGNNGNNRGNMNAPSFHDFKKQASFFLKEKIKTARLALTDVTPAQLLAEEATNGKPGGPDARTLKMISRAAFEIDDYWRIVGILHKRLVKFDKSNWRTSYQAVIVLEYLLTHGPESVAVEFQRDGDVIREMERFQYIDEKGFNWGLNVRKKCERILKLLEKGPLLKQERDKARKISREIQGFGSFSIRTSSGQQESCVKAFDRSNSQFNDHATNHEDFFSAPNENITIETEKESTGNLSGQVDWTENLAPKERVVVREINEGSLQCAGESKPLLDEQKDESRINMSTQDDDHHPFDDAEHVTALSLLSTAEMR